MKDIPKKKELPADILESFKQVEEALVNIELVLDEVLCGAGSTRKDMGHEDPRCEECVCRS